MPVVVVLFGPPLPGRDKLERALEGSLPADTKILADAFRTRTERDAAARAIAAAGARPLFVAWECSAAEAEREIYRHYASMPRRFADQRWDEFLDDFASREAPGPEAQPLLVVHAGEPLDKAVAGVQGLVGGAPTPAASATSVLVVDDDPGQRDLLADALTLLGCSVSTASTADDALALARTRPFALLVTDHHMPGTSGAELAATVRLIQPGVGIAIITGHADEACAALVDARAADVVLEKPFGIADLIHVVDELATRRRVRAP